MAIYQIRYILNGFRVGKIPDKSKIWIKNNTAFFQRNGNELSCLILTKDENYEDKIQEISKDALTFTKIYSMLLNQGYTVEYSGTSHLQSIKEIGKILAVTKTLTIKNLKYVSEDSVDELKKIYDQIRGSIQKFQSLQLALDYWVLAKEYQFKAGKNEPIQFLHAMIALEALVGADTEISYRISIRLAVLLGLLGRNSLEVFRNMKKLYGKRSLLVHGNTGIEDSSKITSQEINTILQYAKDSILCCIILTKRLYNLKGEMDFRNYFLKTLDESILDTSKRKELTQHLKHDKLMEFIST